MVTKFKLYTNNKSKYSSSIFDLISGDNKETKQTKGFAYLLSADQMTLINFLLLNQVKIAINQQLSQKFNIKDIVHANISAERYTKSGQRVDILIDLEMISSEKIALIIEAKNISVTHNSDKIGYQLQQYLNEGELEDLSNHKKIGITLTKHKNFSDNNISITWDEIVSLLSILKNDNDSLPKQYLNYLLKTDKTMKYYEAEVLSIAAGDSIEFINRHLVYECPDNSNYNYAKKPIFLAFRYRDGTMKKLYKLDDIISLDISSNTEIDNFINSDFDEEQKARVISYIKDRQDNPTPKSSFGTGKKKFYILSSQNSSIINLINEPKPEKNNVKHTYYTLKEILTLSTLSRKG